MERWVIGLGAALAAALALLALRRPLGWVWRTAVRSALGLCCLWAFNQAGALIGVQVGVNLLSGLILGVLGAPGFGLLLMAQWALR